MMTNCVKCLLWLCCLLVLGQAPVMAQRVVSKTVARTGGSWALYRQGGATYIKMDDLCRFYGFRAMKAVSRKGYKTYGAKNRYISFRAGSKDFYVNNYRYMLSFPVIASGNYLLISTTDVKKLVDPVLRPRYSRDTGPVNTVVIDAGHGGHDAGAVSAYSCEKVVNLQLAQRLATRLKKRGLRVVMTRRGDYFLTLRQRVEIANKYPKCIFVSIHHNSARTNGLGIETFTLAPQGTTSPFARKRLRTVLAGNHQDSENIALATAIHSRAIKKTGAFDRGIKRAGFSVLCSIRRPAILFEGGFVSHPKEGRKIATAAYQDLLADALCEGIISYCGVVGGRSKKLRKTRSL